MGTSSHHAMRLTLCEYVQSIKDNIEKPPEQKLAYQIPIGIAKSVMKLTFIADKSKTAMGHLHAIEYLCCLFKLYGIHHDEVKRKLLYLSLFGDAHICFRPLNDKCRLDWEYLRKAFYLKYYTPIESYDDCCHIYNFWPHVGESIAQSWWMLNELIRKNPCHGIPDSPILINFYVRLPQHHREFLDNSSEGSFTHRTQQESRESLDTISNNIVVWDLDKGNQSRLNMNMHV
jgi:hypothetical protein